jgi:hypothetical protein
MEVYPLGSLRSWLLDGALTGLGVPPTVLGVVILVVTWAEGSPGDGVVVGLLVSAGVGLGLGLLTAPAAWRVATLFWPRSLLVMSLGPVLGALCAALLLHLLSWAIDGRPPPSKIDRWLMLLSLGASTLGPPWVAYVAVRSRGRSGTPVVLVTLCWAAAGTALLMGAEWLRRYGWTR